MAHYNPPLSHHPLTTPIPPQPVIPSHPPCFLSVRFSGILDALKFSQPVLQRAAPGLHTQPALQRHRCSVPLWANKNKMLLLKKTGPFHISFYLRKWKMPKRCIEVKLAWIVAQSLGYVNQPPPCAPADHLQSLISLPTPGLEHP